MHNINKNKLRVIKILCLITLISITGCDINSKGATSIIKGAKITRTKEFESQFGEVNQVTYPTFSFSYPEGWEIITNEITQQSEIVEITDNKGAKVKFTFYAYPKDYEFSTSSVNMQRVEAYRIAPSKFEAGYVQGVDYSNLGEFAVAKLKVTGDLDMNNDSDFTTIDGSEVYTVLPLQDIKNREDVNKPLIIDYSFYYSGYISFQSDDIKNLSTNQKKSIIKIMKSFTVQE